jgi:hypothetical protein
MFAFRRSTNVAFGGKVDWRKASVADIGGDLKGVGEKLAICLPRDTFKDAGGMGPGSKSRWRFARNGSQTCSIGRRANGASLMP